MEIAKISAIVAIAFSIFSIGVTLTLYANLSSNRENVDGVLREQSDQIKSLGSKLNAIQATLESQKSDIAQMKVQMNKTDSGFQEQRIDFVALNQTLHNLRINTTEYSAGITVTLVPGGQGISKARCNPGEIVTGGGYDTSDSSIIVLHSGIGTEPGWDVIAKNTGTTEQGYYSFAICAKLSP